MIPDTASKKFRKNLVNASLTIAALGLFSIFILPKFSGGSTYSVVNAEIPKIPLKSSETPLPSKGDSPLMSMPLDQLTSGLAKKLENQPDNLAGWTLLGRSYATLGNTKGADEAFAKAIALAPRDASVRVTYGEALVSAAEDQVTPAARKVFVDAQAIDASHPGVRYHLALSDFQAGKIQEAYDAWNKLAGEASQGTPWLSRVQSKLELAAGKLGIEAPQRRIEHTVVAQKNSLPSGLTLNQIGGQYNVTPVNQNPMILGMVQRLADRLESNPNDLDGWLKLGKSYRVLGEHGKSLSAYQKAAGLAPDNSQVQELYKQAGALVR